eukprot:9483813-Pyramimonas_sp.AAC.1
MASRAVRLFTQVGEMAQAPRKQIGPVVVPVLVTQHEFYELGPGTVRCRHCSKEARTRESYLKLFSAPCTGPPVLGSGHRLARWGNAAICEICGHYSVQ